MLANFVLTFIIISIISLHDSLPAILTGCQMGRVLAVLKPSFLKRFIEQVAETQSDICTSDTAQDNTYSNVMPAKHQRRTQRAEPSEQHGKTETDAGKAWLHAHEKR